MTTPESPSGYQPESPESWRELLRREDPPAEYGDLPLLQRRRARKKWRSARRDQRAEWVRQQRRNTPTGVHIPIAALVLAASVALGSWLIPQHHTAQHDARTAPSPAASIPAPAGTTASTATSSASASPAPAMTPGQVAQAFTSAYCTRKPPLDITHTAAVTRAAPYASTALVDNLDAFDDHDFDVLVARQVADAHPTAVAITEPTAVQRPAPDTPLRVYLQATATISATGTSDYTYTRTFTLEVARADTTSAWMVTRVLGLAR